MKPLYPPQALRTALSTLAFGLVVILVSGCGGGGKQDPNSGKSRSGESSESIQSPESPSHSSRGQGSGCFADVLNNTTYDAIQFGMDRSDVLATVQCAPDTQGFDEDTWYSEEDKRAELSVYYSYDESSDQIREVFSKYYKEQLASVPAIMPTPVAAVCTSQHINAAKATSIHEALHWPQGMSPDEVNAAIGCAPSIVERHMGMVGEEAEGEYVFPPYAIYTWHYFDTDMKEYAIKVAFREAEGIAVGAQTSFD